jgi:hypothetical protein
MNPLLKRLDEMALRLQADPSALALLALGSAGPDVRRLDEHSDLDFFVITEDKQRLLGEVSWLGSPIEWLHRNTRDGYKALVADVYHEFAVFEPEELPNIPFAPGRVVWARPGFDVGPLTPVMSPQPPTEWLLDEVLSNLFVGLHRWLRGERLAAIKRCVNRSNASLSAHCRAPSKRTSYTVNIRLRRCMKIRRRRRFMSTGSRRRAPL